MELKQLDRRTMGTYWTAVAFVILIALSGAMSMIYRDYQGRIGAARQSTMNLAQALAEHTTQIFIKLDYLGRAVMEDRSDPIIGADMLSEIMKRRVAAEPAATAIAIVDKHGRVVASSVAAFPAGLDMTGTDTFEMFSGSDAPQSYISRPYRADPGMHGEWTGWTMNYTQKIENEAGAFDGFVLIIVDAPFLYGFYDGLKLQDGQVVGLVGEDGIIRASNVAEVITRNIGPLIGTEIRSRGGVQIALSIHSGVERVFAHSRSAVAPLLSYAGVPTAPIYKAWLVSSGITAAALLALFAALAALGVILGKYVNNRASLVANTLDAARIRQEREFLEAVLNTGGALVAVTDPEGRFVVANPAFRAIFRIEQGNAGSLAGNDNLLEYALGSTLREIVDKLPYQTNRTVVSRDAEKRELSWTVTSMRSKEGAIKNLVAIGFDITERRAVELAIYQSGKMITLGEMATGIAHEVNQPLATITMALDNLRERLKGGKAERDFIDTSLQLISDQVERAAAIAGHMRIYGHRSNGNLYALDPARAIEGALSIAEALFEKAGIKLRKNYRPGEYQILADITLIEQIVLNVLLNARDAILEEQSRIEETSGAAGWIEISLDGEPAGKMIAITIRDSGPGIAPAIADRLFEPFFTTKPIGSGTGLGLSLSYGMARDLGGRIDVCNTGCGAEFRILMPAFT